MPTYQYQCTECGKALEVVQKFTDEALRVCPNCDGALRKVFSAVGIVFKGSGFYRNDSRSAPSTAAAGSSSSTSTTAPSGGSSSSTDSASGTGTKSSSPTTTPAASPKASPSAGTA